MFSLVKVVSFCNDLHAFLHFHVTICFINLVSACADLRLSMFMNSKVLALISEAIVGNKQFTIKADLVILLIARFAVTRRNLSIMVAAQSSIFQKITRYF